MLNIFDKIQNMLNLEALFKPNLIVRYTKYKKYFLILTLTISSTNTLYNNA